jgi:hypothetical protein
MNLGAGPRPILAVAGEIGLLPEELRLFGTSIDVVPARQRQPRKHLSRRRLLPAMRDLMAWRQVVRMKGSQHEGWLAHRLLLGSTMRPDRASGDCTVGRTMSGVRETFE